jgi:methyltransferase
LTLAFGLPQILVLLVALQRLGELLLARRNTQRLLAQGAREVGRGHYPFFILLHGSWLLAIFLAAPPVGALSYPLLLLFLLLQAGRIWVVASLGGYWTTRVITLPGAPLVRRGPYRYLKHPNYLIVIGEIAVLPLTFGLWEIALLFSLANLLLLFHRVRVEERALLARREGKECY